MKIKNNVRIVCFIVFDPELLFIIKYSIATIVGDTAKY